MSPFTPPSIWVVNIKVPFRNDDIRKLVEYLSKLPSHLYRVNAAYGEMIIRYWSGYPLFKPNYNFKFWFADYNLAIQFAQEWKGEVKEI